MNLHANILCCLLYVSGEQVWAGSFNARIHVIDTQSFQVKILLVDHKDIVSDMILSEDKRVAFTASMNGQIITWNIETLVKVREFCLELKKKTLNVIKHHGNKLWCCTKYDVKVVTENGDVLYSFTHPTIDQLTSAVLFQTILIIDDQLWAGCNRQGQLVCWNTSTFELLDVIDIENCNGISKLEAVHSRIISEAQQYFTKMSPFPLNDRFGLAARKAKSTSLMSQQENEKKTLDGHEDAIRSICLAEERYVMTGAGSSDGKVAIWRAKFVMT
ncbi:putative DENN domain-containing protein 3 isoform X3 [Apostichopus japonicus]|uniref:Putative DENN domain-containing protein 3 isoform X3 n=1 Tax=Stichopus japonicus TaxID=307972 RepID=A0A2G8JYR9_STIJA|nr:putative DENN domain-containing protein 3 isoform X3 [Apostichopus japonicus]